MNKTLFLIFIISLSIFCQDSIFKPYTYEENGRDWPGNCAKGKKQSPINIIDGLNTVDDNESYLEFEYKMTPEFAMQMSKFKYNGRSIEAKIDIGDMTFVMGDGTKETYKSSKIVVHYPAEHTITIDKQSPNYPIEVQIWHNFIKSTNPKVTNKQLRVENAVVCILFNDNSRLPSGSFFFSRMGIDGKQIRPDGTPKTASPDENIQIMDVERGNLPSGFEVYALMSIRNLLNLDHHIYRYYGSETNPPCSENTQYFIFAVERSITEGQSGFLKAQLSKLREKPNDEANINTAVADLYGNNRATQVFDEVTRGKVYSMKRGIGKIEGMAFPKG